MTELEAAQTRNRASSRAPEVRPPGAAPPTHKRAGAPIFPRVMPPFIGRDAVRVDADGALWVARARNVTDVRPIYDVFDAAGQRQRQVQLGANSRIVGFSARAVYVARRDDDDLEYLARYRR